MEKNPSGRGGGNAHDRAVARVSAKKPVPIPEEKPLPDSESPAPRSALTATNRRDQILSIALDVLLMAIPAIVPLPAAVRWVFWSAAFGVLVFLCEMRVKPEIKLSQKILVGALSAMIFGTLTLPISHRQWREEKSRALEGDLTPVPDSPDSKLNPKIQIGKNGAQFMWTINTPPEGSQFRFAYDAGLRVAEGANGPEITTPVRDRQGNLVGEINNNHWRVYPPFCSDKNYDKHSIEMKDSGGHVVLQVTLLRDRVQIQGEWHTQFGQGVRFIESGNGSIATFWPNPQAEQRLEELIQPMFVYPSDEHWGELVTKPQQ